MENKKELTFVKKETLFYNEEACFNYSTIYNDKIDVSIDVTSIIKKNCLDKNNNIIFDKSKNEIFGDPMHGIEKRLYCTYPNGKKFVSEENDNFFQPRYKLVCGAIFKNESWIFKEWLDHYLKQGVEHFYLIDNGSDDDYLPILLPYIEKKQITLFKDDRRHLQIELYNTYIFPKAKVSSDWLIISDLDEFIYSRKEFKTICEYLDVLPKYVSTIYIPWKMFGSSGFKEHPNDGIINNFIHRKKYDGKTSLTLGCVSYNHIESKFIFRPDSTNEVFSIHSIQNINGKSITSDGKIALKGQFQNIDESILENSNIHLNHYAIQSWEFFSKIKMTRTDANSSESDNIRDENYFKMYDWNDISDTELKLLTNS